MLAYMTTSASDNKTVSSHPSTRQAQPYLPVFTSPPGEAETLQAYQAVLDQWPVPYTELMVPTSFGDTHVIASGPEHAPPVILMHALFATATVWYANVGDLSRDYRVYAVDTMDEANKSRPTQPITTPKQYAQWLGEVLDELHVEKAHLIGNSVGAFLCATFAMESPERVDKLVLIAPAGTIHQIMPFYIHIFLPKGLYLFFPWMPGLKTLMRKGVTWMRNGLPLNPAWERLFHLLLLHGGMVSRVFPKVYGPEDMQRIKAQTLFLVGDREVIYHPEDAIKAAKKLMPKIQAEIIPNAHHLAALAQPAIVDQRILQFLQQEDGRTGP